MEENQNNLPAKKEETLVDKMQGEMAASFISSILPKVQPLIGPALDGLKDFLGDNNFTIIIRQGKRTGSTKVIVLDNNKFPGYSIINEQDKKEFSIDETCLKGLYDSEEFIRMLFAGELTKLSELLGPKDGK